MLSKVNTLAYGTCNRKSLTEHNVSYNGQYK